MIQIQRPQMILASLLSVALLSACATTYSQSGQPTLGAMEYERIIEKESQIGQKYNGLYNTLDIEATLIRPQISASMNLKKAEIYLWSAEKFAEESKNVLASASKETQIFLAFFSPERKVNDLSKTSTVWKVFLDTNGKRYEAKVTKDKSAFVEIVSLFPYFTRFHTAYNLTFPVPMNTIASQSAKLIITGPVGSVEMTFPEPK